MNNSRQPRKPKTQPSHSGGPPIPPNKTAHGLNDEPPEGAPLFISDPVILKELATKLHKRPFQIVADALELGQLILREIPSTSRRQRKLQKNTDFGHNVLHDL